jgi:outer membrane lipoprotein-sorting protein
MPKLARLLLLTALAMPTAALAQSAEQRGTEIAKKSDAANEGFKSEMATLEMTLVNAHGDRTTRKMRSQAIEVAGDGDRSRIEFEWPADVKGTRMLTWTHKKGDDDQWLFLPAINRVKRISSGSKSGSFMGSEFAYEDLGSQEIEKYKWKYLGDEAIGGRKTAKLERTPVDERSGYSKQILWMDYEYQNPLKIEYYDRKGELLKTATFDGYQKLGKFYRPGKLSMINHQTKKSSVLTFSGRKLGEALKDKDFESDSLGG